jgi:hypothetical protein
MEVEAAVGAATLWPVSTVSRRLFHAGLLRRRFPETLALLEAGRISWPQAVALAEITAQLDDEPARRVQQRVLSRMPGQSVATTRKALHRAVLAVDPAGAQRRHDAQAARRRVELRPEQDGMATLALYATAPSATAVLAAVSEHAGKAGPADERNVDQRRADALVRLVLTAAGVRTDETQRPATAPPVPALVHVTVSAQTLLGADEKPGQLRGYGPITADQARQLAFAPGSVWRRLLTAPDGSLMHADPHTYRPTAAVARTVRLRDQHCTFPGCTMPAQRCDLDHITPFNHRDPTAGGTTEPENLHVLCRRHHRLKTAGSWRLTRHSDGTTVWTSSTGHVYTSPATSQALAG